MSVLESGEKLSKQACDSTNVGDMLFVMDSSSAFMCNGKGWTPLKGEKGETSADGSSCTVKSVKKDKRTGYELTCDNAVVDTLWNGEKGGNGSSCTAKSVKKGTLTGYEFTCGGAVVDTLWNGEKGGNGSSCTAKTVKKGTLTGFEFICGGSVVDTLWNGAKGDNGKDAVNCKIENDASGVLLIICGSDTTETFKALCGDKPYDPAKELCIEGNLYSCGDKPYNPAKELCVEGELYSCSDKPFNPETHKCNDGVVSVIPKNCGDTQYNPETHYCKAGTEVAEMQECGDKLYNPETLFCDIRDNQVYKMVEICDESKENCQTWMAENLNYDDSDAMPNLTGATWCGGGVHESKTEGDCSKYGRLYTWAAAINKSEDECGNEHGCSNKNECTQGVCPNGWHLPDTTEWNTLFTAVGGSSTAGKMLRSTSGWNSSGNGTDDYGFSALPAGYVYSSNFHYIGMYAYFWSSTEYDNDSDFAYGLYFYYGDKDAYLEANSKISGYSVRCVKNNND